MVANVSRPDKQGSRVSWPATAREGSQPLPALPSKAAEGSPADGPKWSPYLSQGSSQVGVRTPTQALHLSCSPGNAAAGLAAAGAAPDGSHRQAATGPPPHGQGPALPARIHPHSPAMSAATPRLGTSRHPAGTRPGHPCQRHSPPGGAHSRGAQQHPVPSPPGQPRPPTPRLWDLALEHSEPQGQGGPAGTRAAGGAAPALVPGARPSWKASWAQSSSGQPLPGSVRIPPGARQPRSVPLACEPSRGTASAMPRLQSRAMEIRRGSQAPENLPESGRSWPSLQPCAHRPAFNALKSQWTRLLLPASARRRGLTHTLAAAGPGSGTGTEAQAARALHARAAGNSPRQRGQPPASQAPGGRCSCRSPWRASSPRGSCPPSPASPALCRSAMSLGMPPPLSTGCPTAVLQDTLRPREDPGRASPRAQPQGAAHRREVQARFCAPRPPGAALCLCSGNLPQSSALAREPTHRTPRPLPRSFSSLCSPDAAA